MSNVRLDGVPRDPATYRVTVNNLLVDGGDDVTTSREVPASARIGAGVDLDAFVAYLGANSSVSPAPTDRVTEPPFPWADGHPRHVAAAR